MTNETSNPQSAIRNPQSKKPIIGLIGGIGSGKSLISAEFARHGGKVVSGDQAGHEALRQPEIRDAVIARFGQEIIGTDGEIERRKLGRIVFGDIAQRKALELLVFPYIERRLREEIAEAQADPKVAFVVLDAAIMLEAGWNNVCDWIVYSDVPRDIRLHRLQQQRGWSEKEVTAREAAQMPLTEKKTRADFVIDNAGTAEQTAAQVKRLLQQLGIG
jgi:dephospho-CoA kinase